MDELEKRVERLEFIVEIVVVGAGGWFLFKVLTSLGPRDKDE